MTRKAIIGFDGLAPNDAINFDFPGDYRALEVETNVHTCPSWNAIFTGRNRNDEGVFDFWKMPDGEPTGDQTELAANSDERFTYDELRTDDYLWERFDVDVVSAPVVLPTFSNVDDPPGNAATWPTTRDEAFDAIDRLWDETKRRDRVITVFPHPDKANHLRDNPDKDFDADDREDVVSSLVDVAHGVAEAFDEWVFISDHGEPAAPAEYVGPDERFTVATHDPVGVVASNAVDVGGETNVSIYNRLAEFLQE